MKRSVIFTVLCSSLLAAAIPAFLTHCAVAARGVTSKGVLPPASKESPFVNSLGMKFVPVPGTNILMCTTETTVAQWQAAGMAYRAPGYPQRGDHPAVNMRWQELKAWCAWLSKTEHRKYRLPTEAEWRAAAGTSTYPWGDQWPPPPGAGNLMGKEHHSSAASKAFLTSPEHGFEARGIGIISGYRDSFVFTAPVASFSANQLGIFDLAGNVSEYRNESYHGCKGGGWGFGSQVLYPGLNDSPRPYSEFLRNDQSAGGFLFDQGFRLVLEG